MKLKKIRYSSAVYFGVLALVLQLILGALQWPARDQLALMGYEVNAINLFVYAPLLGAIVGFLFAAIAILIYNVVAKKFPIAWEVKK